MAVIHGAMESISTVERKGWFFHAVLAVERTAVAFFCSFVARGPAYTKREISSKNKSVYEKAVTGI